MISDGFYKIFGKSLTNERQNIPLSFNKMANVIYGFQKSMYWLVGGSTGCTTKDTKIKIRRVK
jgi:hypothetical protein